MTSKLTREELLNIIETDHVQCGEASALARMALAAMDSEPVAWLLSGGGAKNVVCFDSGNAYSDPLREVTPLYRHAQQPVVPPEQHWEELCREYPDMSIGDAIIRAAWWNHCRAAILQAGTLIGEGTKLPTLKCLEIVKFNADCALSDPESIYASEFFLSLDEAFGEKENYKEPVQAKAVSMLIGEVLRLHNYQTGSSPVIPGAEQRIADAVELLKKAAPAMLADNSGPDGQLAGRLKSPVIPDGYVMVPKEPAEEMLQASYREAAVYSPTAYRAMIASAPQEGKQ